MHRSKEVQESCKLAPQRHSSLIFYPLVGFFGAFITLTFSKFMLNHRQGLTHFYDRQGLYDDTLLHIRLNLSVMLKTALSRTRSILRNMESEESGTDSSTTEGRSNSRSLWIWTAHGENNGTTWQHDAALHEGVYQTQLLTMAFLDGHYHTPALVIETFNNYQRGAVIHLALRRLKELYPTSVKASRTRSSFG